jgi:segregation and condensation protein B
MDDSTPATADAPEAMTDRVVEAEPFPTEAPDAPARRAVDADRVEGDRVEALIFSTPVPLPASRIADVLGLGSSDGVREAVRALNAIYARTGRSFRIEQVAGGYRMLTLPDYESLLDRLLRRESESKLTPAAQETLAVIAYKQPVLRSDVEGVRGVGCGETIRSLMDKKLVKIAGRAELPGRPILYGTTRRFLEAFGLNSVKDLPSPDGADEPK